MISLGVAVWMMIPSVLGGQIPAPGAVAQRSEALRQDRRAILDREAAALQALADRLGQAKPDEAQEIRSLLPAKTSKDGATRITLLPEIVPSTQRNGFANIPVIKGVGEPWRAELAGIRDRSVESLLKVANLAAKASPSQLSLADACLRDIIARQPDHAEARRILGYVRHDGGWATPYAVRQLERGLITHPTFGWVESSWVPHLEKGELPAPSRPRQPIRWLPAQEANAARTRFEDGWEIQTEHFLIKTNVQLSEAIGFGQKLESLDDVFLALFIDVLPTDRLPLALRFRSAKLDPGGEKRTHKVFYFASRQEFLDHLQPRQGNALNDSLGFYDDRLKTSYFYFDPNPQIDLESTLYHEGSHQLLFEIAGKSNREKNTGQYWVFEGLGTYFETLTFPGDGSVAEVGGPIGPRLTRARDRLLDLKELIPLNRFVAMDQDRFNSPVGDIYLNYLEAMALTVYLMQHDGGAFREPFLDYVRDAYRGRIKKGAGRSLEDRVGLAYPILAKDLLDYLKTVSPTPVP